MLIGTPHVCRRQQIASASGCTVESLTATNGATKKGTTMNHNELTTLDVSTGNRQADRRSTAVRRCLGGALRILCPLIVAVTGALTVAGSEASATQYVPGASASASFRCDATGHVGSISVLVNSQNGAMQDVGYRMYVKPVGSAGFWTPTRTTTAYQGGARLSGTFTLRGQYQFYLQYYWRTTAGWISRGEWISSYRQAGWFRGVWERDFTTCTI